VLGLVSTDPPELLQLPLLLLLDTQADRWYIRHSSHIRGLRLLFVLMLVVAGQLQHDDIAQHIC
jgi:hypothetical protein